MNRIKAIWLEVAFALLISIVIILSISNSVHEIKIESPKALSVRESRIDACGFADYLKEIRKIENGTIFIFFEGSQEEQGYYITEDMVNELMSMGFDQAYLLLEDTSYSFFGVYSDQKVIYQKVTDDATIRYAHFLNNRYIFANSYAKYSVSYGAIYIDHINYSVSNRGFNIVTVDLPANELIDSVSYDVFEEGIPVYRLIDDEISYITDTVKG
jgi:hypothetical protein